ncbi:MAG: T9SS type A sorting domain-containing protein [bacterium]|nr:T9SS type A sorting domain-containing protein [bacterium]
MRTTLLVIILVLTASAAHAQTWALGDTLTVIQRPLPNIPSFVLVGDHLEVTCAATASASGWTVNLERGGLDIPLSVTSAVRDTDTGWWTLRAPMPAVPVLDVYDLHVTADGGIDDTARHAVRPLATFPSDFYFVHVTDTHLPTHLYWDQSGSRSDSTSTMDLRAICEDVNVIDPAFLLITGDFVNEGECEDYLDLRYYSRAQRQLYEFDVPVFLSAGNHDLGGWDDTPPSDGTARRDWWRFFGWKILDAPPASRPWVTQDFSFDYGAVHFTGLEAYDNYDGWRYSTYGGESFVSSQFTWLQQDLAAAAGAHARVLFYHFDFQNEINLNSLGVDMALWGHTHRNSEDASHPYDISTDNASRGTRAFRLVRWQNSALNARPTLYAGSSGQVLTTNFTPANDGTHDLVTVTVGNGHPERFQYGQVRVRMPLAPAYAVTGGTLAQVDGSGATALCYVDADIPAGGNLTVTVQALHNSAVEVPTAAMLTGVAPNPFNPRTIIRYHLPAAADVRLSVFDLRGRELAVLVDGRREAGDHAESWTARAHDGTTLPSGVYLVGFRSGGYNETRKITLMK